MLENTFIHLPNFGPKKERKLWESGISGWDEFLEAFGASQFHKGYCTHISQSQNALKNADADYFGTTLQRNEAWRTFPEFPKIAYLDIETTGLSAENNDLTVIGLFDGIKTKSYINGFNLGDFEKDIKNFDSVITFNGSLFDIPFLKKTGMGTNIPKLHIDLRFVLQSLNIRGGLKKIEAQFGMEREDDLKGLNGYDAVLLWKQYKKYDDDAALDKLVRYNAADISNLKTLMEWAYKEKRKATGFDELAKSG
ncbi:ribonuclease H-like domain-containing protein [Candidatus Micrarchaeota archaeon]|nr:ribonuclease H-like domain-containing protein [Candidatus Micrarchaeota archaeon]